MDLWITLALCFLGVYICIHKLDKKIDSLKKSVEELRNKVN